jgi:hypothetical protein
MTHLRRFATSLGRFWANTRGSLTIESLIMFPLLVSWFVATFVFFDIYRINQLNLKANDSLLDLITRWDPTDTPPPDNIDDAYIDGMFTLFNQIIGGRGVTSLRVSSISYDESDDKYTVEWSEGRGNATALAQANVGEVSSRLPFMSDGSTQVVIETYIYYNRFNLLWGFEQISKVNFYEFASTRPRFATSIPFDS